MEKLRILLMVIFVMSCGEEWEDVCVSTAPQLVAGKIKLSGKNNQKLYELKIKLEGKFKLKKLKFGFVLKKGIFRVNINPSHGGSVVYGKEAANYFTIGIEYDIPKTSGGELLVTIDSFLVMSRDTVFKIYLEEIDIEWMGGECNNKDDIIELPPCIILSSPP
jgi:hypothetical protein